jgi:hypothetical protein
MRNRVALFRFDENREFFERFEQSASNRTVLTKFDKNPLTIDIEVIKIN